MADAGNATGRLWVVTCAEEKVSVQARWCRVRVVERYDSAAQHKNGDSCLLLPSGGSGRQSLDFVVYRWLPLSSGTSSFFLLSSAQLVSAVGWLRSEGSALEYIRCCCLLFTYISITGN